MNSLSIDSRVTRLFETEPEIKQLRLDTHSGKISIGFYGPPSPERLTRIQRAVRGEFDGARDISIHSDELSRFFHRHHLNDHVEEFHRSHPAHEPRLIWKRILLPRWRNRPVPAATIRDFRFMLLLAGVCGLGTLGGFLFQRVGFSGLLVAPLFAIAYFTGGWFATQDFWRALKHGKIDIQFLMIAVALGALFVNAWTEGATLLFLFSLSNALEQFANYRTRKTIDSLLKTAPKQALRRKDHAWIEVPVEQVERGDELLVKAGELFPVDGIVIEGATSADESALTGEAIPTAKRIGDSVSGGTLSIDGQSVIRVSRELEESALSRILSLIQLAQQQKAPAQRFTDSFSRYYTWVALSLGAVVFAILLLQQRSASDAFYRAMTVLVVASPCALVLSIPSAILIAIAAGARQGILFRGGVAIENLAGVTQFAFDKTGTLTKGSLIVARINAFDSQSENSLLGTAASVARFSTHPLARAIAREAEQRALSLIEATDFLNVPGLGMEASVNGTRIFMGSRRLMRDRGIALPALASGSDAEVWIAGAQGLGVIHLHDEIRPAAKGVVDFLKDRGLSVALLTGDRSAPAQEVAKRVGIEDVRADFNPQAKLQCIHDWRAVGKKVAMVGDGINDAPSLTAADVSIGMGTRGSDAALEQADVILMHDKIENIEQAVRLSRRARSIIRENIAISLCVILVLIVSALSEKINLTAGVIGHEGSTVVVILNGLRLLGGRKSEGSATSHLKKESKAK
jgi:Cd2+/Zn2+-exporting ATPase